MNGEINVKLYRLYLGSVYGCNYIIDIKFWFLIVCVSNYHPGGYIYIAGNIGHLLLNEQLKLEKQLKKWFSQLLCVALNSLLNCSSIHFECRANSTCFSSDPFLYQTFRVVSIFPENKKYEN